MPFIDETPDQQQPLDLASRIDVPAGFAVTPGEDEFGNAPPDRPAWNWDRAFRTQSEVGAFIASQDQLEPNSVEPGFNAWERIKGTKYEPHWWKFVDIRNSGKAAAIEKDIDRETEDRAVLASGGWRSMVAEGVSSLASPTMLLPGGAFVRSARGGISIGATAFQTGRAALGATAIQEGVLQGIEETRSGGESAAAMGASAFLGGLLGAGGAALLSRSEWRTAVSNLNRELARPPRIAPPGEAANTNVPMAEAVGAAATPRPDIEDLDIAGRAASGLAAATGRLNPSLNLLQSPSAVARQLSAQLFENPLYLRKNMEGVASDQAVETLMKEWNAGLADSLRSTNDAFSEYAKRGGTLRRDEFRQAVGRAMRRGDADAADPEVERVAKAWRAKVFDPLKEQAIKAGLLPEDVTVETAASYFSRMWNVNKLVAQEGRFKDIVTRHVEQTAPRELERFNRRADGRLLSLQRAIDDIEMTKLRRAEEGRIRDDGGEVSAEFDEADIRQAVRIVAGRAPKPNVETLTSWLHRQGGLVDSDGELAFRGITNRSRPGFVVNTARSHIAGIKGGMHLDDAARAAWEDGFFPHLTERPSVDEFIEALERDFHKSARVVREADRGKIRLQEYIEQIEADLARLGGTDPKGPRFSTSEEVKGMVARVRGALDATDDQKLAKLKSEMVELRGKLDEERRTRFLDGDIREHGRAVADEVYDRLTGRAQTGARPEFVKITARGPLKERTFNIPDELVEEFLESDVEVVGRRYTRIMGADVEIANKFGEKPDLSNAINRIRDDYRALRGATNDEKTLRRLAEQEKRDIQNFEAVRDLLRGNFRSSNWQTPFEDVSRIVNIFNYVRSLGEVVLSSLTDAVRPAMVHGLGEYMRTVPALVTGLKGIRMSVREAELAGNVAERILASRMATLAEVTDPYASRGPVEAFMQNMANVASTWNGIRLWTDINKGIAAAMTQNRILRNVERGWDAMKPREQAYMAYLGIDRGKADRIAGQIAKYGETVDGVRVANTESWDDPALVRLYRAAINKDVDSIIVQKGVADVPVFAHTPAGRMILQFKTFALASHQRILLRGLQEDQARFVGGIVAMSAVGMMITYLKALSGNRVDKLQDPQTNPGWWISEGLDRSGVFSVFMELGNVGEKIAGANPVKGPVTAFDEGEAQSQKMQGRDVAGALLGPTAGLISDVSTAVGVPIAAARGEEPRQAQKNAAERLIPFNSYLGMRQMLRYVANPPD